MKPRELGRLAREIATTATAVLALGLAAGCLKDKIVVKVSAASHASLGIYTVSETSIPVGELDSGPIISVLVDKSWTGTVWVAAYASITNSTSFAGVYESGKFGETALNTCISTEDWCTLTNAPLTNGVLNLSAPRQVCFPPR